MSRRLESELEFVERIFFYWEVAQPLRHVFEQLPALEGSIPIKMNVKAPLNGWSKQPNFSDLIGASVESRWSISFQNLSEEQFERLALRFRPFFAQKEETNFLRTISAMVAMNPEMRDWHHDLKTRWNRAVFWGAMGLPASDPPVTTDAIINAGFYSRYFHVTRERRAEAKAYEDCLGTELYWTALVSSVWQRSAIVLDVARQIEDLLIHQKLKTEEELATLKTRIHQPERIVQSYYGGVGGIKLEPL
jgi:hypothetical protein